MTKNEKATMRRKGPHVVESTAERIALRVGEMAKRYPSLLPLMGQIEEACELMIQTYIAGKKIMACGNGGSAADADHIVGELMKSFVLPRPLPAKLREALLDQDPERGAHMAGLLQVGLPALSLTQHTALNTAFANDVAPDLVFAQQVLGLGESGDLLWAITTSGNSPNVVQAAVAARALGMKVLGMTGSGGGALAAFSDILLAVPEKETYKVQELHLPIYHAICIAVESVFFLKAGEEG